MKNIQKERKKRKTSKTNKILKIGALICFVVLFANPVFANNAQMNITLTKIVDQLQAIKPLIEKARIEQDKNPRIKVHFRSWVDGNDVKHSGLYDDINLIQKSVITAIDKERISPRVIRPIKGDFISN